MTDTVVHMPRAAGEAEAGFMNRTFPLEEADQGEVHLQLRFVPNF